jgi:hypothetical protein
VSIEVIAMSLLFRLRRWACYRYKEPEVRCRACDVKLPKDPLWWVELSPGVYVCEDCEDPIKLEAGLRYPEWFHQPLPAEQETKFGVLKLPDESETRYYTCALCDEQHQMDQVCVNEMVRVLTCEKCSRVTCVCDDEKPKTPPGDVGDWLRDVDMERMFGRGVQ